MLIVCEHMWLEIRGVFFGRMAILCTYPGTDTYCLRNMEMGKYPVHNEGRAV
ncbi:MAG: hypothetical protein ACYDHX_07890 [Methanothrix sp.]